MSKRYPRSCASGWLYPSAVYRHFGVLLQLRTLRPVVKQHDATYGSATERDLQRCGSNRGITERGDHHSFGSCPYGLTAGKDRHYSRPVRWTSHTGGDGIKEWPWRPLLYFAAQAGWGLGLPPRPGGNERAQSSPSCTRMACATASMSLSSSLPRRSLSRRLATVAI